MGVRRVCTVCAPCGPFGPKSLNCGIVGMGVFLWFGRVGLVVFSFVVRQLLAKPNKNGTQIDHKWDQAGPGKGEGATENQHK